MCTVTFIPDGSGVCYLTSNRDENRGRARALSPRRYGDLVYPMDPVAGGSWVVSRGGDAAILLNGAFEGHERKAPYRRSRGLVFLDIVRAEDALREWEDILLEGIEPFTLILFVGNRLYECRWDGAGRHLRELAASEAHIWCSVTLYDEVARKDRENLLAEWRRQGSVSTGRILELHRAAAIGGEVATASITSIRVSGGRGKMKYIDLREEEGGSMNPFLIRLKHWEYWPFGLVYLPVFVYWAWLSLRARSLFFFSPANPTITNGGFLLESKKQIYDLMPAGVYPRTLYCRRGMRMDQIRLQLAIEGLKFPLMAKPDIGQRGMGVELLKDECALLLYALRSKVDFLLQEYIDYPMEIGVFYYRMPGEEKGVITGIVGKEFLSVTGDGRRTVEELLQQEERYVLQLRALRRTAGRRLERVPLRGEVVELVPYGNHSRGAKFLDETGRVSPRLERVIDELCRRIPGFYFGRLDIRFESWELLEAGAAFSVIELNGAGSEPTHIYDPRHSLFFAWKEIIRHLQILFRVSRASRRLHGLAPMGFWAGLKMLGEYRRHEKLIK